MSWLALDGKTLEHQNEGLRVRHHLAYLQAGYKTQDGYKVGLLGTRLTLFIPGSNEGGFSAQHRGMNSSK